MNKISAVILTKNSERLLGEVLDSLRMLDEVVVLDNGSSDSTLEIARQFSNVSIHFHEFIGFGAMKQLGAHLARNSWILSIDSDEVASAELIGELLNTPLNPECIYSYDVHNHYKGKRILGCGWGDDRFLAIYHRDVANFDDSKVHEKIVRKDGAKITEIALKGHISHYPFACAGDFLKKMDAYSELFANEQKNRRASSPLKAVLHATWSFFRSYFLKKGVLDGYEGFVISCYNAQSVFWKYIKLYEAQKS